MWIQKSRSEGPVLDRRRVVPFLVALGAAAALFAHSGHATGPATSAATATGETRHDRSAPSTEAPSPPPSPAAGVAGPATATGPVRVDMRNVDLHVAPDVVLGIRRLRGTFENTGKTAFPIFDDRESFLVRIESGEIAISTASLTALMNEHVLAYHKAPLKDVEIKARDGRLEQKGRLKKGISVPFAMKATVEATEDGKIRLRPRSVKAASIPVRSLMNLLGVEMDDLVKIEPGRGITVEENDILLDPETLLPPPRIRGRVTAVRLEGDQVVQTFGPAEAEPRPLSATARAPNHMYFVGGRLRFGKLIMDGADLELIDEDPKDPFDFDLDHYNDMLVAGYSKNTPEHGLRTHMPDYADIGRRSERSRPAASGSP
jgi:hypothetical protein